MSNEAVEAKPTRIRYAVEYTDPSGRRRRAWRKTFTRAERFKRGLRMGADAIIRLVAREVKQ